MYKRKRVMYQIYTYREIELNPTNIITARTYGVMMRATCNTTGYTNIRIVCTQRFPCCDGD